MQDLKITLVQADQRWEDKTANFNNYQRLLNNIETELIVLPEMFNTGFSMETSHLGEDWNDSVSIEWLRELSREKDAAVYTSLIIKDGNSFYNRGVFITPDGDVRKYDKRKTFSLAGEDQFFKSGSEEQIISYKEWNIQLQICYDLRFPEIVRNRILSNQSPAYDVILYVANWPQKRSEHWKCLLRARAIENQCYVVGVNRVGKDDNDIVYSGDSGLVNALGSVEQLEEMKEEVKSFVLKKSELNLIREKIPFLKDR